MNRNLSKFFIIVLLISFVIPSTVLATWWNPFTWFQKDESVNFVQEQP